MPIVICPQCRASLEISEQAPALLLCPRCFSSVPNRAPTADELQRANQLLPIPRQVRFDEKASVAGIVLLSLLIATGVAVLAHGALGRMTCSVIASLGTLALVTAIVVLARPRRGIGRDVDPPTDPAADASRVLSYERPPQYRTDGVKQMAWDRALAKVVVRIAVSCAILVGVALLIFVSICGLR
jgi:hypothetical protein